MTEQCSSVATGGGQIVEEFSRQDEEDVVSSLLSRPKGQ